MNSTHRKAVAAVGLTAVAILGASACSSEKASDTASSVSSGASSMSSSVMSSSSSSAPMTGAADPASGLVGSSCAAYAKQVPEGPGSVAGMAKDPVATAASNNPMLTTLTAAVSGKLNPGVNLVDTLNGGEFTVIAPTDDAFAKIDAATIDKLKTDTDLLTKILTYHVVPGQLAPDAVVGEHATVEKGMVDVTGSGDSLKVNDANVICGGVHTANATVYLIDSVLMPTS
jgi:uncharacterized surface protein with fasciclin (FAS1) repeats